MGNPKIYYFTNIAPHYRKEIWELLARDDNWEFNFVFGDNYAKSEIKPIDVSQDWIKSRYIKVKNLAVKGVLFWQIGALNVALSQRIDVVILLGEMHIVSNWLLAIWLRLKGTRVLFWGHGFSGNEGQIKKRIRVAFNSLAHGHFLYGERSKVIMQELGFGSDVLHCVNNSLSHSVQKSIRKKVEKKKVLPYFDNNNLPLLVFIGRLSQVKRLDVLIDALIILNSQEPCYNLLIVGDGSERRALHSKALRGGQQGQIYFFGASYDERVNGWILSNADLCISPGNIGLTAIHTMSYGTPCATHNDLSNQMPEFECIQDGVTGFFFEKNNARDLAKKTEHWFSDKANKRNEVRQSCYSMIDQFYNPYFQLSVFKKVILDQ